MSDDVKDVEVPEPAIAAANALEKPDTEEGGGEALDALSEKLDAFSALLHSDEAAADEILDELGGHGPVERDIVAELASPRPLRAPSRFDQAHRLVMKSLEVLKRNGSRPPKLPRNLGPLNPVATWVIQLFTRMIVQNHITRLTSNLHRLYGRREAWALPGSDEMVSLKRARMQLERLVADYRGKVLGLPGFLVGGAVVSSALGGLRALAETVMGNRFLVVVATLVILGFLLGAAWCVLRAAAVARKRIRLTTDRPMKALYDTVGGCGKPPKDDAMRFALISLIAMAVAWVVIPAGIVMVIR